MRAFIPPPGLLRNLLMVAAVGVAAFLVTWASGALDGLASVFPLNSEAFSGILLVTLVVIALAAVLRSRRKQGPVAEPPVEQEALYGEPGFALKVMETMGQGLAVTDAQSRLEYVNPAFARMLGYEQGEVLGKPARTFVALADLEIFEKALAERAQGRAGTYEIRLLRRDGSFLEVLVNAVPSAAVQEGGAIAVITDLTERKQFEKRLQEALEAAQETIRHRTASLAGVSHDIRTPLAGILGFAEVLEEELTGAHREMAHIIIQSGRRMMETLTSVLDFARIEAGALSEVPLAPVDVVAEVLDAARLFEPVAVQKGLLLQVEKPPYPVLAPLNAGFLHRVLCNLLSNAIKFTHAGGISVEVEMVGEEAWIRVRDTGLGIDETFLPHLFEEFKQAAPRVDQAPEGAGLGLAISRRLVEAMHGRIEVFSDKGTGTVFLLAFPCHPADDLLPPSGEASSSPSLYE